MEQLEKRFYPREELAEIAGLDIHGHNFSAQMKSYLERWGYGYEFVPRKGFLITKIPETAEEKLVELLRRVFHVDTQIDTYAFSCFVFAFSLIGGFESMPWDTRERLFYEYFGIYVSQRTMISWRNCLCDSRTMVNFGRGDLWHTCTRDGRKIQEPADPQSEEYKEYCDKRSELLEEMEENDTISKREKWRRMIQHLYKEYGVYYYCKLIAFNAWGPEVDALQDLTYAVITKTD